MTKRNPIWFVVIVAFAVFSIFLLSSNMAALNDDNTLTANKVDGTLTLDGVADEAFWSTADSLVLTDVGTSDITLLAVHDGTDIFVYANWTDSTQNIDYKRWEYNGTSWVNWGTKGENLGKAFNEDRLAFSITNISSEIVCGHYTGESGTADEDPSVPFQFDIWHWKSTRSDPAGWIDDKYWDGTGRHGDAKTAGGYTDNSVVSKAANSAEITTKLGNISAVTAFSNDDRPYKDASGNVIAWVDGVNSTVLSDTISGYTTVKPTGSRGDVTVKSVHDGSYWHVEFKRALDTGNSANDVAFEEGKSYSFYAAVWDNDGWIEHDVFGGKANPTELTLTIATAASTGTPGFIFFIVPIGVIAYITIRKTRK